MVAGKTVKLTLEVFDAYWNPIPTDIAKAALSAKYENEDNTNVDFKWTGGKDGEIYADVRITNTGTKQFTSYLNGTEIKCRNCEIEIKWDVI
jgi:hypothetical protein